MRLYDLVEIKRVFTTDGIHVSGIETYPIDKVEELLRKYSQLIFFIIRVEECIDPDTWGREAAKEILEKQLDTPWKKIKELEL